MDRDNRPLKFTKRCAVFMIALVSLVLSVAFLTGLR